MNCQDVARLIEGGSLRAISAEDRVRAELHAHQCRRCALPWIAHSRLAALPIPPMPPDLSRHCLALVARAGKVPASQRAPRMFIVVSGLVALAAAASMLGVSLSGKLAPQHDGLLMGANEPPVFSLPAANGDPSETAGQAVAAARLAQAAANTLQDLPLFPPPHDVGQARGARFQMAIDKFVELHPEVAQVPPAGTLYDGTIVVRDDGKVLDHSLRAVTPEEQRLSLEDPHRGVPNDGREPFGSHLPKGAQLANGRTVGADLALHAVVVHNTYDPARSSLRVEQIIRTKRPESMGPLTQRRASHLTVLLSAEGAIRREVAGHTDWDAMQEQEKWSTNRRADAMAALLGVSKDEIGLMGNVSIVAGDANRGVVVDYAWQRLPGESSPQYRQGWDPNYQEDVDTATALAVVERVMPDAFLGGTRPQALGIPAIVLSEKGEFIRTGRVRSSDPQRTFQGVSIAMIRMLELENDKGAAASVYFVWQKAPTGMEP